MTRPFALLLTLTTLVAPAAAQPVAPPPETLLSANSVAYLRFDGFAPNRAEYNKTILAGLLRDQFGPLIEDVTKRIADAIGPRALSERLLDGADPAQLLEVQVAMKQLPRLIEYLDHNGFALGVEVVDPTTETGEFQLTFVFPDGGLPENRSAIFGGIKLLGLASDTEVATVKANGRSLLVFDTPEEFRVACWQEGRHVLLTVGTLDFEHTLGIVNGERENLTSTKAFKDVIGFIDYPTVEHGFVDVDGIADLVEKAVPPLADVIVQLGFRDLKDVQFHVGYEGELVRSTIILNTPGERRGLVKILAGTGSLNPEELPPLPSGSGSVMASTIDLAGTYDEILAMLDRTLGVFAPFAKNQVQKDIDEMKRVLGVDLRTDVLAHLESPIVGFNSAGDGPIGLGFGLAIKTRNPEALKKSLGTIVRSLGAFTEVGFRVSTRELHGVELTMVEGTGDGFFFKPTYAIHDGWLVAGLLPAPVQGFAYRSQKETATGRTPARWELPAAARKALETTMANNSGELTGLYVSDPRETVQGVLSIAPVLVQMISQFSGGSDFDISLIPNAQSVTDPLHENVTVVVDDGSSIRYEGYSTLPMPIQLTGLESYAYFLGFAFLGFGF